ncbi:PP2C family protein-serine/threonine phosphatase [Streptomyces sp. cmx-4-25]|uniref:PP2C family protein-serine/threonine phosphatase n=1 Tax=unclassified Streptomyces TaxID=2593676 RepID=UPI00397FD146
MEDGWLGLAEVPAAAEDAAPVASPDVVARNLRDRFGARYVSFLFLDVVGREVVRVTEKADTRQGRRADRIPPAGSAHDRRTHRAMLDHGRRTFATGQLLRIALDGSGTRLVNAGHLWPLRLRDGRVGEVPLVVDLPFGIATQVPHRVQDFDLRPGDRLVLYTDGAQERRTESVDLPRLIHDTAAEHPREVVRALTAAVTDAAGDHLQDDATLVRLDWHGPRAGGRHAHAGADT